MSKDTLSHPFFLILLLLLLSSWTLFYKLGSPYFYHIRDESRRAEVAREMLESGNWLFPQLEEKITLNKPPLFYWAVLLCSLKSGVNERTARLPSAAAGVGTVIITFLLGTLFLNKNAGFRAALILATTSLFTDQARSAEMESMLTFFITTSIFFFLKGYHEPARRGLWFSLFFVALGLGTLTKGPFAFTFPLIPIVAYLFTYREQRLLLSRPFLWGILFFFIILLPWPLVILKTQPQFLFIVFRETIGRALTGFAHREPFYYYLKNMPGSFFPWVFFLPCAMVLAFSKELNVHKRKIIFLLLWFFGNLCFLSLSKSKREFYLLPLVPGAALLISVTWEPLWNWIKKQSFLWKTNHHVPLVVSLSGASFFLLSFLTGNPLSFNFPGTHFPRIPSLLLFIGVISMATAQVKRWFPLLKPSIIVLSLMVTTTLLFQYIYLTYTVPLRNVLDSGKHFYLQVSHLVPQAEPLGFFGDEENYAFIFYAKRRVTTLKTSEEVFAFMSASERRYLVVTERDLRKAPKVPWKVVSKGEYSEHRSWGGYMLLCNQ